MHLVKKDIRKLFQLGKIRLYNTLLHKKEKSSNIYIPLIQNINV